MAAALAGQSEAASEAVVTAGIPTALHSELEEAAGGQDVLTAVNLLQLLVEVRRGLGRGGDWILRSGKNGLFKGIPVP